jgi:2-haloacid dehalogenase
VIVFDVNETLLDLSVLDEHFDRIFGSASVRRRWFGLVLRNALTLTVTGDHVDFVHVGGASLQMVADQEDVELSQADRAAISATMTNLPAHPDVLPNLERLRGAGFTMAALTNSPPEAATSQLVNAGIAPFLDRIMTVEPTGMFKPAPEVYQMAARELDVTTGEMLMVAAHDWDIAGAMRAGCSGAYLMRPGMVCNPLYPEPTIAEPTFDRLTDRILELRR